MTLFEAIIMGIIQGATEFLPVSSSGHLAIFSILFGVKTETGLLFDILLHLGTLIAICVVYYKDVFGMIIEFIRMVGDFIHNIRAKMWNRKHKKQKEIRTLVCNANRKMALMILVTSVPTGIIGFAASDLVEQLSELLIVPGIFLLLTATLLLISDRLPDGSITPKEASYTSAFIVGIAQGIATMPGLSRSGTTITACLGCKYDRNFAVKYSFLMSIPAIIGAALKELLDVKGMAIPAQEILYYIIGTVVAGLVGYICIKTMLKIVRKKKFTYFAIYCYVMGIIAIAGHFYLN